MGWTCYVWRKHWRMYSLPIVMKQEKSVFILFARVWNGISCGKMTTRNTVTDAQHLFWSCLFLSKHGTSVTAAMWAVAPLHSPPPGTLWHLPLCQALPTVSCGRSTFFIYKILFAVPAAIFTKTRARLHRANVRTLLQLICPGASIAGQSV